MIGKDPREIPTQFPDGKTESETEIAFSHGNI